MSVTKVSLSCARCGNEKFELPDHPVSSSIVTCSGCGAKGKYGDLMGSAKRQITSQVKKELQNAFKGIKGFKIS